MSSAIFDSLLEPTFLLSADGTVIYLNESAISMVGHAKRKVLKKMKLSEVIPHEEVSFLEKQLADLTDASPYKEFSFENVDGVHCKIQLTIQPYSLEPEKTFVAFTRDVTLEERLQAKYKAELEKIERYIEELKTAKGKLEDYSKNLESMVAERTAEVLKLNSTMKALLNSLQQGFFIFNQEGLILPVTSAACENTVQTNPAGKEIWSVLKLPENKVEGFKKWMFTVFSEMLSFEDLAPLGPNRFAHSEGKIIELKYYPMRHETTSAIENIVVVAEDISGLVEAQIAAEFEKASAQMITNMIKSKTEVSRFIQDADYFLNSLNSELKKTSAWDFELLFRDLHTLKGSAGIFSVKPLADACHHAESWVNENRYDESLKDVSPLKGFITQAESAMTDFKAQVLEIVGQKALSEDRYIELKESELKDFLLSLKHKTPPQVEQQVKHWLLEPISESFKQFTDLAQKLAERLEKKIKPVVFQNSELLVDPSAYRNLFSTFVHAVRNSMDHGIETPWERMEKNKSEEGTIGFQFEMKDQQLEIRFFDDGKGIDPEIIRSKMQSKGAVVDGKTDEEIIQYIFEPSFSTKEEVTDLSGRGVGLDALKDVVHKLNGQIKVQSEIGKGTQIIVSVPEKTFTEAPSVKAA